MFDITYTFSATFLQEQKKTKSLELLRNFVTLFCMLRSQGILLHCIQVEYAKGIPRNDFETTNRSRTKRTSRLI